MILQKDKEKQVADLLLTYGGRGNFGDDAMLVGFLYGMGGKIFDVCLGESEFCVNCDIIKNHHKIKGVNSGIILLELLKHQVIIIPGGTHFSSICHSRRSQNNSLRILLITFMCKLLNKKIFFVNNGYGPFSDNISKNACYWTSVFASGISVRDEVSKKFLNDREIIEGFDLASLIPFQPGEETGNMGRIGISISPLKSIYCNEKDKSLNSIAELLLLYINKGFKIELYIFHNGAKDSDMKYTLELYNILNNINVEIIQYKGNIDQFTQRMSKCDFFIGTKYHAALMCFLFGVPFFGYQTHGKVDNLFSYIQEDYYKINFDTEDIKEIMQNIDTWVNNYDRERIILKSKSYSMRTINGMGVCKHQ